MTSSHRHSSTASLPSTYAGSGLSSDPAPRRLIERMVAAAYGLTYDRIVEPFRPFQELLDEITSFVERSGGDGSKVTVLDVACGTGTVARHLSKRGYRVVALDAVGPLVDVARARSHPGDPVAPTFFHLDAARDVVPRAGTYDVLVSMHTLSWHPDPLGLLAACHGSLRPGGHAIVLAYACPAHVGPTFRRIRRQRGLATAVHALRWLVPTAAFEIFRHYDRHYMAEPDFHRALTDTGFELLEARRTFLADISLLAWVRRPDRDPRGASSPAP